MKDKQGTLFSVMRVTVITCKCGGTYYKKEDGTWISIFPCSRNCRSSVFTTGHHIEFRWPVGSVLIFIEEEEIET